jgi:rhodanese-related sulfurtransferase
MDHMTAPQVAAWIADTDRAAPLLLDVRETWEFDTARIAGATLVPMSTIVEQLDAVRALRADSADAARSIVCICHHGARSMQVAAFLEKNGFDQIVNLTGGIHAWSQQVDASVPVY